jgi:hypothetical protein
MLQGAMDATVVAYHGLIEGPSVVHGFSREIARESGNGKAGGCRPGCVDVMAMHWSRQSYIDERCMVDRALDGRAQGRAGADPPPRPSIVVQPRRLPTQIA